VSFDSKVTDGGRRKRTYVHTTFKGDQTRFAAERAASLRRAFLSAASTEDMEAIVRDIVTEAKTGRYNERRWARETIFDRCLGQPLPLDVMEQLADLQRMVMGDRAQLTEGLVIDQREDGDD
jgi:hypothetical protein